ncbi:DUF4931 domain-containing protein [Lactovum miscens]|uniref:Galactose-1-phosphate uridylyltransferase n=1 Tax=Lactovum miscens TaxID=190387 RepID=A0A841CB03_9LACT|nr:DUF4931 domain-containing protein [Lactovum miscens]MBB5888360.1 galactose-1-phosphate uridylyltransferase [Lactovum miscens]
MITHTHDPLIFNAGVNKIKYAKDGPSNDNCPFCDIEQLSNIHKTQDDMIWLDNKFKTLENSLMTVLIESSEHLGDVTTYSQEKNRQLFKFAMDCWQEVIDSKKYKSTIMFKNFGPMSGGSLRHPHMQIIGLEDVDAYDEISTDNFTGIEVKRYENLEVTISERPVMGFAEINIIQRGTENLEKFADYAQASAKYYMNEFMDGRCNSYNLFFYKIHGKNICKIVPRFLTSPYFIGYKIPQIYTDARIHEIIKELREKL